MPFLIHLKQLAENLPVGLGRPLSNIPFTARLGTAYWGACKSITKNKFGASAAQTQEQLKKLQALVRFAATNAPFYCEFYKESGFSVNQLETWDYWKRIPEGSKADLQGVDLADRYVPGEKKLKINTGGISGQSLEFYLDKHAFESHLFPISTNKIENLMVFDKRLEREIILAEVAPAMETIFKPHFGWLDILDER